MGLHENVAAMRLWVSCYFKTRVGTRAYKNDAAMRLKEMAVPLHIELADYQEFRLAASGRYV